MNAPNGPIEYILDGLEAHSAHLTKAELKAELAEAGIEVEAFLAKTRALVQKHLKAERTSWMKVADRTKEALEVAASKIGSWKDRSENEIRAAFARLQAEKMAVAFRNQGDLSVEDMASILDKSEELKARRDASLG